MEALLTIQSKNSSGNKAIQEYLRKPLLTGIEKSIGVKVTPELDINNELHVLIVKITVGGFYGKIIDTQKDIFITQMTKKTVEYFQSVKQHNNVTVTVKEL
jgi:hypothetical protein